MNQTTRRAYDSWRLPPNMSAQLVEQWPLKPLGEICEILDKLRKPITKRDRVSGEYPYYGATGIVDYVDGYIFDEKLILVGEDGAKWESGDNTAFAVEGKCWVNNHAHVIRPNRNIVLDNWLIYFLNMSDLTEHITGLTVPKLNQGKLRAIQIPIPPLEEQQRIVSILDEGFDNIEHNSTLIQARIDDSKELFEATLDEIFSKFNEGWSGTKLGEISSKIGSGATPKGGKESYKSEGVSLIRSMNVHDKYFKHKDLAFIDESQAEKLSNVIVESDDVLLNITGASVARCNLAPKEIIPARVNQHVMIIRPLDEKLDAHFLHFMLISKPYKDKLLATGNQGGTTRQAITKNQVENFEVWYPSSMQEQKEIVNRITSLLLESTKLENTYSRKLESLDELKQSISQEAFNGTL